VGKDVEGHASEVGRSFEGSERREAQRRHVSTTAGGMVKGSVART
jgi:hypothetical protein